MDLERSSALVGRLPDPEPTSRAIPRLVIAHFVFLLSGGSDGQMAGTEIAAAYWVPDADLIAPGPRSEVAVETPVGTRDFPCFWIAGQPV